ncbi:MAG: PAS domain S-box protein [Methanoregula sp.]
MDKEFEIERIEDFLKNNPKGLTINELSKKISLNRSTTAKYLNSLVSSGRAEMRALGNAKLFYHTKRLPLANLLNLSSDLIIILDKELFIQDANNAFLNYFQLTQEVLKNQKIEHSVLASYFTHDHFDALQKATEGTTLAFEDCFEVSGDDRNFTTKIVPLVFGNGDQAVVIIMDDITKMKKCQNELELVKGQITKCIKNNTKLQNKILEHKQVEKALKQSEQRLENIIDFLPDPTVAIDREGKVIVWNKAIEDMSGIKREEILGIGDYAYSVPIYGKRRPILVDFVLGNEEDKKKYYSHVEKKDDKLISELFVPTLYDGKGAYIWFIASPLYDTKGNVIGAIESIRDISDQNRFSLSRNAS